MSVNVWQLLLGWSVEFESGDDEGSDSEWRGFQPYSTFSFGGSWGYAVVWLGMRLSNNMGGRTGLCYLLPAAANAVRSRLAAGWALATCYAGS